MKKVLAVLFSVLLAAGLFGCAGSEETKEEGKKSYTIGICQIVQHPALDAATQGFIDAVNELLPGQVTFDNQNASGETANCATIVNGFVANNVDMILANATPPLQAAAAATDKIPILGTSVTDYAAALDIEDYNGTVGGNISGYSDLVSLDGVAPMIEEWFPVAEYKKVGYLFCTAEANSRVQVEDLDKLLKAAGYETAEYAFTDSNDLPGIVEKATQDCDIIYIPTDNTAAANTEAIANITGPAKQVVVAGEEGICKNLGVCTLTIDYYKLGRATGEMAVRILKGEADIATTPIAYLDPTKEYDADVCASLGLTPLEGYVAIEK